MIKSRVLIVSASLFAATLTGCSGGGVSDSPPGPYAFKELVKSQLKDPGSAQFRNEQVYKLDSGNYAMCAEVNAKNSFGGYTGFKRVIAGGSLALVESEGYDAIFSEMWTNVCILHKGKSGSE